MYERTCETVWTVLSLCWTAPADSALDVTETASSTPVLRAARRWKTQGADVLCSLGFDDQYIYSVDGKALRIGAVSCAALLGAVTCKFGKH